MTVFNARSTTFTNNSAGAAGNALAQLILQAVPAVTTIVAADCVIVGSSREIAFLIYS